MASGPLSSTAKKLALVMAMMMTVTMVMHRSIGWNSSSRQHHQCNRTKYEIANLHGFLSSRPLFS